MNLRARPACPQAGLDVRIDAGNGSMSARRGGQSCAAIRPGYFATVIWVRSVRACWSGWYMASMVAGIAAKLPSMVARAW